jgi:hypothetical protein
MNNCSESFVFLSRSIKFLWERRYTIQDLEHRPEFQSSIEAVKIVPDRTKKEVTLLLMDR